MLMSGWRSSKQAEKKKFCDGTKKEVLMTITQHML